MTNELIEMAERLDLVRHYVRGNPGMTIEEAAAMFRKMGEQKPVAWAQVVHDKVWGVFKYKGDAERYLEKIHVDAVVKPLYASPVPAITAEQKAEVMAIVSEIAGEAQDNGCRMEPGDWLPERVAAIEALLDKIGGCAR